MLLHELRTEVVHYCRLMSQIGLVKLTSGNISRRDPDSGLVAISPTSLPYELMTPADVVIIDLDGRVVEGHLQPSSEHRVHLAIYRARPEVNAVVHTHSEYASTLAVMNEGLPCVIVNLAFAGGSIDVAPYCTPGTWALGESAVQGMGAKKGVLLQNHGVVAAGSTLLDAFTNAVYIEEGAHMVLAARAAGGAVTYLSDDEVRKIQLAYAPAAAVTK